VTILAYVMFFGWIPAVLAFFALLPARRAAAIAVVGAWLLLPPVTLPISHLPDYSKNTAAIYGLVLGTLLIRPDYLLAFRPRWFDLPMLLWCFCPLPTSLHNGLGWYDGLSGSLQHTVDWGLAYLMGRLYFNDLEGLREFTRAMVVGGLAYVAPCVFEMRMSPFFLRLFYGIGKWQGTRLGGYRPHVFFWTGLELGMWMTAASLVAWWLWRCGALRRLGGLPFGWLVAILLVTTVLCRSTGAMLLLGLGMVVLWASTRFHTRILVWGLALFGPIYAGIRIPNLWSGQQAVDLAKALIDPDRAQSLGYRFMAEQLLIARAIQQPVFGWGGFSRPAVYDEFGHVIGMDGMWIITLGTNGFVGLGLFYLVLALPIMRFLWCTSVRQWRHPAVAPAAAAAVLLGLYVIDCTSNAFINCVYVTLAGGLASIGPAQLGAVAREKGRSGVRAGPGATGDRGAASGRGPGQPDDLDCREEPPPAGSLPGPEGIGLVDRYRHLGRVMKREGRVSEAQAAWRCALEILTRQAASNPGDRDLRRRWCDCANDLVWLEVNQPGPPSPDPTSAIALARHVVELDPDRAAYWNTLGVAYFRAGEFRSAIEALERSTALGGGGTAFDEVFLAMAHAHLGDPERARQRLAHALSLRDRDHPGHPELTRFCDEALAILAAPPGAEAVAH
jgi:tetratricopeptide (TPR) repeat protein